MTRLLAVLLTLAATPALAHHPLGGMPMETFAHGLMSGVGHPVLGFDHLFFVVAMGVAAALTGHRMTAPLAYIAAMLGGCLLMSAGVGLPARELAIVASLIVLGFALASGRALSLLPALALFAGFGLFHGSAFGDSLAAQEGGAGGAVLFGYLLGLGAVQYGIAVAAGLLAGRATDTPAIGGRLTGAMVAGAGVFLALEAAEGPLLAALAAG